MKRTWARASYPEPNPGADGPLPLRAIEKSELIADLGTALADRTGYAVGKIGLSEQRWLYYRIFLERRPSPIQRKAYEMGLAYHCLRQSGIYPANPDFIQSFNDFYVSHLVNLDCLGILGTEIEPAIVAHYDLKAKFIPYLDTEPDRSVPSDASHCYLDHLCGKRLLILAPFAEFLKERATEAIFEATWSKTGKKWFHPASVDAIEFPYALDNSTWSRFPTVLDLFSSIVQGVERREFDIVFIGAGALGIPLASQIKRMGRVAMSLGGHLQVLFGVWGKRWRDRPDWQANYFNENWISVPARYHPADKDRLNDDGAYW